MTDEPMRSLMSHIAMEIQGGHLDPVLRTGLGKSSTTEEIDQDPEPVGRQSRTITYSGFLSPVTRARFFWNTSLSRAFEASFRVVSPGRTSRAFW